MLFLLCGKVGLAANAFQLLLPPTFLVLVGGVHELHANGAAVGFTQSIHQLPQTHRLSAEEGIAGVKNRFLVGIIEAVER